MTDFVPAWAHPFFDRLGVAPHLTLPARPTRDMGVRRRQRTRRQGGGRRLGGRAGHPLVGECRRVRGRAPADPTARRGASSIWAVRTTICTATARRAPGSSAALAPEVELDQRAASSAPTCKGSTLAFAHGLDWCIENGVQVVNLSLSTSNDDYAETFWDLVDQAAFRRE